MMPDDLSRAFCCKTRLRVGLVCLLLIVSMVVPSGYAQPRQPALLAAAIAGSALDLAAMSLSPDDLAALGMTGFGQRTSAMVSRDEQASQAAPTLGIDADDVGRALAAAGFARRYQRELARPRRVDRASSRLDAFVTSYVVEYVSPAGAAAGFGLLEAESPAANAQDVPGTRGFGERSEMTRLRRESVRGEPYRALDLTFHYGALVGGVTIGAFGSREPDVAMAEALAARLLAKIEAGLGRSAPGLSNRVVRLEGAGVETRFDAYGRLAGVTFPNDAETPDEFAGRSERYGEAIDVYGVGQSIAAGGAARTDDIRYLALLARFASEEEAEVWLRGSLERTLGSPNVMAAEPAAGAALAGDSSLALAVTAERSSAGMALGYLVAVRVGPEVAQVELLGSPDLPLAAVEELASRQAACLQAGGCRGGASPPASVTAAPATPTAGSGARGPCAGMPGPNLPAVLGAPPGPPAAGSEREAGAAPNIILIVTDDLDARSVQCMPNVRRLLMDEGITFSNAFVTTPLCCPSRASILRGQYAHNHGVFNNSGADGGFPAFHARGDEESTLATWLQAAGYHTALFGKYLNRYPRGAGAAYVPPGWDEWAAFASAEDAGGSGSYYSGYTLNVNGVLIDYGSQPEDYSTDIVAARAINFVQRAPESGDPFFLYLSPFAPHGPSTPAARHGAAFSAAAAPRVPSFGEEDVSDKPPWVRANPPFDANDMALIDDRYQRRLRSLLAVDEMVAALVEALDATGALDDTVIVFTSDNGFHLGEHRLPIGKQSAYDESIRVPLIARGPGMPMGATVDRLVLNIDLAPTFAALAGATIPEFVDGRSLVPLLAGSEPSSWRDGFLVERYGRARSGEQNGLDDGGWGGDREADGVPRISPIDAPPYVALRTVRYLYVEYDDGERELYDLAADPYQLRNLAAGADPALIARLGADLERLRACAAADCRAAVGPDVTP